MVLSFIVNQVNLGLSGTTITCQLPAVLFIHKLSSKPDPTDKFVVKKLLVGASHLNLTSDIRSPILPPVLHKLVQSAPFVSDSKFKATMLRAMYLLAFYAFLRPSEFTFHTGSSHILCTQNLHWILPKHSPNPF